MNMNLRSFLAAAFASLIALQVISATVFAKPLYPPGYEPKSDKDKPAGEQADSEDVSKLTPFARVGVIQFDELSKRKAGGDKFHSILLGRLKNAQPETEFVSIDDAKLDKDTPLMGDTARHIGERHKVDAILTGAFIVQVQGGIYPTRANSVPVGKIGIDCRIIETNSGWSRGKASVAWDKNKIYSQSIRTQKDLEGKLMRDGVDDLISVLTETGYLRHSPLYAAQVDGDAFGEFAETICKTIRSAEAAFYAHNGYYGDFGQMFEKGFLDEWFSAGGTKIEDFQNRKSVVVSIMVGESGQEYEFDIIAPGAGKWIVDQTGEIRSIMD